MSRLIEISVTDGISAAALYRVLDLVEPTAGKNGQTPRPTARWDIDPKTGRPVCSWRMTHDLGRIALDR